MASTSKVPRTHCATATTSSVLATAPWESGQRVRSRWVMKLDTEQRDLKRAGAAVVIVEVVG